MGPDRFFYPLDMASAESFNLAAQLKIAADTIIIQNAEAVDNCDWMAGHFDHLVRIQSQIRSMTDSQ